MHVFLLLALSAAPSLDLTWGTGPQGLQQLVKTPDATLRKQVLACAKGYGVKTLERRGTNAAVVWSAADPATDALDGVSKAEQVALLSIMGRQARGAEFDVLIPQPGGRFIPVSVWWSTPEQVTFESGPEWSPPPPGDVTIDSLQARFKVGPVTDGDAKWTPEALGALEQALATLTPRELALIEGLQFRRARANSRHLALYQRGDTTNRIDVYDAAFSLDGEQFVGGPAAPRAFLQTALVHELGHALADHRFRTLGLANLQRRQAYEAKKQAGQATDADFKQVDDAVRALLALDAANAPDGRPVERAFARVLPVKQSPTPYGRSRPAEHFAECFSLFKNDRPALERIAPDAAAWFDAGTHVGIAGKPLD